MTTESFEELRQRMLRDADVQEMIRARAYEIYRMRGLQPGSAAHDWFQAEGEVLAFLLAHQDEQVTEPRSEPVASASIVEPSAQPGAADSSTELSPQPTAPKKPRQRSAPRTASAKKTTASKVGSKKAAGSDSKPKRSRKKSKPEDKSI
ncbi:MAG TPA: DUF2934 domain-containing protein [Blastocatellia bacterium]|nr:DUF2934 domain-containing protein [Blastocatellia bacterium]